MCGIAGFIANERIDFEDVLLGMANKLHHRGPDSKGIWYDEKIGVGLAHARLSILDLTETGNQPMISVTGRYIIIFNGEIYNNITLRNELDLISKNKWKGTSDTETLLHGIERWGIETTLQKCVGMFAIALWDCQELTLTLIRDRMGEKPLYYGWVNNNFVFSSELNALKKIPNFKNEINSDSLSLYMSYSSVPEPYSIYNDIYKLKSGSFLQFCKKENKICRHKEYWSVESIANQNNLPSFNGTVEKAISSLEDLLMDSVGLQMISDVPTGAFLSGGVDSSAIAALMQAQSARKIDTFSIGFDEKAYNEAEYAKSVANHLGTNHHETYVTFKDALEIVPKISKIYSEPFSDSSQIPTYLVSQIAKRNVTVCLSGDAGDELFGGYARYQLANNLWNKVSKFPPSLKTVVHNIIKYLPYSFWHTILYPLKGKKNKIDLPINFADKLLKANKLLKIETRKDFYHLGFMNHNLDLKNWLVHSNKPGTIFENNKLKLDSFITEMMATDLMTYLTNNNLAKVDRAAMYNSLETRVPFLDHRVVSFALSVPLAYKLRNGVDKWILRQVLYKHVPKNLIERPKKGFAVPMEIWLRGPLKEWGESLLNEKRLKEEGFFNPKFINKKWEEHLSGKRNWQVELWNVLVFQSWLDEQKN